MGKKKTTPKRDKTNEITKYLKLTQEAQAKYGNKTIIFYQVGSFYEVYGLEDPDTKEVSGSHILEFARICDMKVTKKSNMNAVDGKTVLMAGEPMHGNPERKIKKLVECGFTVPVYTQDPTVPNIRSLTHVESPGTEVNIDNEIITNNIMCLWLNKRDKTMINKHPFIVLGMCCIDVCTGAVNVYEYKKKIIKRHQSTIFDSLERFYKIHNPNEIVIIHNMTNSTEIDEMIQFTGIQCIKTHIFHIDDEELFHHDAIKNATSQIYQQSILERYYEIPDYAVFTATHQLESQPIATQAYCFILDFIFSHNANLVKKISEPFTENIENSLLLANHSLCQLNILNTGEIKGHLSSVLSLLNKTKTPMGKRKFKQQLLHPTTKYDYLNDEYNIVSHIIDNWEIFEPIRQQFSQFRDLEKLYRKIILNKVSPAELVKFYDNMGLILELNTNLSKDDVLQKYIGDKIHDISNIESNCNQLRNTLEQNLVLEKAAFVSNISNFDVNFFQRDINLELDSTQDSIDQNMTQLKDIQKFFNKCVSLIEKKTGSEFVKIHTPEKSPLTLMMTQKRSTFLKKALQKVDFETYPTMNIVVDNIEFKGARSGSNKAIQSPKLLSIYNTIFNGTNKLKEILSDQYRTFVRTLQETDKEMTQFVKYISLLDVIMNKAFVAQKYNYCRPFICEDGEKSFLDAVQLRHPLIEELQKTANSETYVANDLYIGYKNQDGVLLYGTNAAGKTSFIRSMGIAVIMAQAGCFVAASEFTYKPYTAIYTRILGNDNLFKGLSTFQVEMCELNTILKQADENSLILGDELCSGTEINSAIALVTSGIQELNEKHSSYIFATHLHQLTKLFEITEIERLVFKHMSVEYDVATDELIWTRILEDGSGDDMYGLEVCKSLQMPEKFLERAFRLRLKLLPEKKGILNNKKSKYHSKKIKGNCELCGAVGVDIHHLIPQEMADRNGFINHVHKNHPANMINICKKCHSKETKNKTKRRKVKTSKGMKLLAV